MRSTEGPAKSTKYTSPGLRGRADGSAEAAELRIMPSGPNRRVSPYVIQSLPPETEQKRLTSSWIRALNATHGRERNAAKQTETSSEHCDGQETSVS